MFKCDLKNASLLTPITSPNTILRSPTQLKRILEENVDLFFWYLPISTMNFLLEWVLSSSEIRLLSVISMRQITFSWLQRWFSLWLWISHRRTIDRVLCDKRANDVWSNIIGRQINCDKSTWTKTPSFTPCPIFTQLPNLSYRVKMQFPL